MAVTASDIQAMPGLSGVATADAQWWIDIAPEYLDPDVYGTGSRADTVVQLWVAHQLTLASEQGAGAGGPVASKRVGDVEVRYDTSAISATGDDLSQTQWGRRLRTLMRVTTAPLIPTSARTSTSSV